MVYKHPSKSNIVILTGAGISAESGLSTFRDENGLWCQHRIEDVATPEGFRRDPQLVHRFYNQRRAQLKDVKPNAAHLALAEWERRWKEEERGNFLLVTQNVDDLHQRAGSRNIIALHGELLKARCSHTEKVMAWSEDLATDLPCACCGNPGAMRPHIVWFGEMPLEMETIYAALSECDMFVSIGTSGTVYPAAGFVMEARRNQKARTVEINLESSGSPYFHEVFEGKASQLVPNLANSIS
ncbi:MAG: NAD-dependent protein deacylase [Alphaproteobacteria bacterium]|nr:NAD-dependent protein deacylase [Alphaproteobacteria bacterium]